MAMCLPLAILLGYLLAQPLEGESIGVVVLVLAVLSVPLFMKWYHPLLVLSWNALINPFFLPGRPALWMVMSFVGLLFAALNRSVNPDRKFIIIPSLIRPLMFLFIVVIVTAMMNGGLGVRSLGGERYGGKNYFYIFAAIAGYFVFCSQSIPRERATLYVAMFFLTSLTSFVASLAIAAGPGFYFLLNLFPTSEAVDSGTSVVSAPTGISRITGLGVASTAISSFLLASFGIRGLFDMGKPWRLFLFLLTLFASAASGFRSNLILFSLVFAVLFFLEGLHRTRFLPALLALCLISTVIIIPFSDKLPWVVQRTLSFLPVKVDPIVKQEATSSSEWRIEMWKSVLPMIPQYFFKGKGYTLDPNELYLAVESAYRHMDNQYAGSLLAGDYHNGPLTVIIPFGIFGVIALAWFLTAAFRVLYKYYCFGDPSLRNVNLSSTLGS